MTHPVLFDAHQLGLGATGNETWARCVSQAIESDAAEEGWTYAVSTAGRRWLPPEVNAERICEVSASSVRRLLWDLPRWSRRHRPAAVVAQYTLPPVSAPGVVAVHDLSFEAPGARAWLSARQRLRYRTTIRLSVRRAAVVVVPSEWTRQDLLQRYEVAPDRVLVAPCAVDPALLRLLAAEPERRDERLVVLAVGTVLPRKNLVVTARAVAGLRAQGHPAVLRLVGPVPPSGAPVMAELSSLLPENALEVVGAVPSEQLAGEYRSATVFAFPSLYEGFGIPVVEAMAAGVPVVASTATCLPEVVGKGGLLVDPYDVDGWSTALARAAGEARASLRRAGELRAREFTWAATASVVQRAVAMARAAA